MNPADHIGYGIMGTADGFDMQSAGILTDMDAGPIIDLNNEEIFAPRGTEILSTIQQVEQGHRYTYFLIYRFAKEMDRNRDGTFYGSVVVLKDCTADAGAIYATLLELAANVKIYLDHDHRFQVPMDQIDFRLPDSLGNLIHSLQPMQGQLPPIQNQTGLFFPYHGLAKDKLRFIDSILHNLPLPELDNAPLGSFAKIYASADEGVSDIVQEKRALQVVPASLTLKIEKDYEAALENNQALDKERRSLKTKVTEYEGILGGIEAAEKRRAEIQKEIEQKNKASDLAAGHLEKLEKEVKEHEKELEKLKAETGRLEKKREAARQEKNKSFKNLKSEVRRLESENKKLKEQLAASQPASANAQDQQSHAAYASGNENSDGQFNDLADANQGFQHHEPNDHDWGAHDDNDQLEGQEAREGQPGFLGRIINWLARFSNPRGIASIIVFGLVLSGAVYIFSNWESFIGQSTASVQGAPNLETLRGLEDEIVNYKTYDARKHQAYLQSLKKFTELQEGAPEKRRAIELRDEVLRVAFGYLGTKLNGGITQQEHGALIEEFNLLKGDYPQTYKALNSRYGLDHIASGIQKLYDTPVAAPSPSDEAAANDNGGLSYEDEQYLEEVKAYLDEVNKKGRNYRMYDQSILDKHIDNLKAKGLEGHATYQYLMEVYEDWRGLGAPKYKVRATTDIGPDPGGGAMSIARKLIEQVGGKLDPKCTEEWLTQHIIKFNPSDVAEDGTIKRSGNIVVYYILK